MYSFEKIQEEDYENIIQIMTRAFDDDTQIHTGDKAGGPSGYDNGELLKKLMDSFHARKIKYRGKILGIFALKIEKNQGILELFCIDPSYKSKGHGTKIWHEIEKAYPVKVWYLETPDYSVRNRYFYEKKCGFSVIGKKKYEKTAAPICFQRRALLNPLIKQTKLRRKKQKFKYIDNTVFYVILTIASKMRRTHKWAGKHHF